MNLLKETTELWATQPTMALEMFIDSRFSVHSIQSNKALEEFQFLDGGIRQMPHYTFSRATEGTKDDSALVKELCETLWEDIKSAWPPGTLLMWRKRPYITEDSGTVTALMRIGSFIPIDKCLIEIR